MTFEEITEQILGREHSQANFISKNLARRMAALEILEGFRTVGEAREWARDMQDGDVCFTAYGYEINNRTIQAALDRFFPADKVSDNALLDMEGLVSGQTKERRKDKV